MHTYAHTYTHTLSHTHMSCLLRRPGYALFPPRSYLSHMHANTHAKNDLQVLEEGCYVLLALRITLYVMPVFDCGMQCEGDTDRQTETARQRDREREKRQSDGLSKLLLLWYELCHYVALS